MAEAPHGMRYVFGPVPSRRLGRSLGVDLAPRKVCTMDCVYCQVGRTTRKTLRREHFTPVRAVLDEIRDKLRRGPRPDYITLSGSGEPTLNADLREVILGVKAMTDVPVAVLTNGSLLSDETVRRDCAEADLVIPSLDAGDEETFLRVNRPEPSLRFDRFVEGLEAFRRDYAGPIWLEVFLIEGVNSDRESLAKIKRLIERIRPDRVQLNTAVRPTAEPSVAALSETALKAAAEFLGPGVEIIADYRREGKEAALAVEDAEVLEMIRRRPVTVEEIAAGIGIHRAEAVKHVGRLIAAGRIAPERRGGKVYFTAS